MYSDVFETSCLAILYSYPKCEPKKRHVKGNCRMLGLVIATVKRQVSGCGCEAQAFDFVPSPPKAVPKLSQQPFEMKQQCSEELQ